MKVPGRFRALLRTFALVGVVLFLVAVRVVAGAQQELSAGDALAEAGDLEGALTHWRRAAKWYIPGAPFAGDAVDRMVGLAEERQASGDSEGALQGWRSVHAAALGARSLFVPYESARTQADEAIDALTRGQAPPIAAVPPSGASVFFLLAVLGFWFFVASVLLLAHRAIDEEDRILSGPFRRYGLATVVSLAAMIAGLALA